MGVTLEDLKWTLVVIAIILIGATVGGTVSYLIFKP